MNQWEIVSCSPGNEIITERMKVINGWLVRDIMSIQVQNNFGVLNTSSSVSMCFVPDKNHEWILE